MLSPRRTSNKMRSTDTASVWRSARAAPGCDRARARAPGRILFPGRTNNEMLKLVMDAKGPFPKKMLRRAAFAEKHFDNDVGLSFRLWEEDPVTKRPVRRAPAHAAEALAALLPCLAAAAGRAGRSERTRLASGPREPWPG